MINAGRKYLGANDLHGTVFVTSGLGGMSGAQAKAAVIAGCVCIVAEIDAAALHKRQAQGWLMESSCLLDKVIARAKEARHKRQPLSIGYLGNVVDLWEALVADHRATGENFVQLGSDQTSCHNVYNGGYYPVGVTYEDAKKMMVTDPEQFKHLVHASLRRQIAAIDYLSEKGALHFWDYGNAFLLECLRAGADVAKHGKTAGDGDCNQFKYPSYVQDIMGLAGIVISF